MPVLCPWLPSVAPSCRGGRGRGGGVLVAGAVRHVPPAAQFRRALSPPAAGSPTSSGAASRPGEVSAPGLAVLLGPCAGWLPPVARLWSSTGPPSPALPLNFSSTQEQDQPRQHQQQTPAASPKEKSTLETPYRPVAAVAVPRRESRVVLVAVPTGGPCLPGRTPASPHLCRLSPCAVGFVQNPSSACPRHVYRAKLKQRGVRGE